MRFLTFTILLVGGVCFSLMAVDEEKELNVSTVFMNHWTKGSWMGEVARDFQAHTGVKVNLIDIEKLAVANVKKSTNIKNLQKRVGMYVAQQMLSGTPAVDLVSLGARDVYAISQGLYDIEVEGKY